MGINLYGHYSFWPGYFLEVTCLFILLAIATMFLFDRKDKERNLFISFIALLLAFLLALTMVIPKSLDIKHLKEKDYSETQGVLNSTYIEIKADKKSDNRNITHISVEGQKFNLKGTHSYFEDFLGDIVRVYYLPNSKYVIEVEVLISKK